MKRGSTIIWKHDRRKTTYSIIGFAVDEEGYPTVVYTPTEEPGKLHTRRCAEFFDGRYRQIEVDDLEEELEDVKAMSDAVQSIRDPYHVTAKTLQSAFSAPEEFLAALDPQKHAAKDGATVADRKRAIREEIIARRDTRVTRSGE